MKIEMWGIAKTKYSFFAESELLFTKRIKHYCKFKVHYFDPVKNSSKLSPPQLKKMEAQLILKHLKNTDYLVLLDEGGKSYNSIKFAEKLGSYQLRSIPRLIFLIGGAHGFDAQLHSIAKEKLSLSPMTFSHQLIRSIFLEQLYRGFTILNNESYHNN